MLASSYRMWKMTPTENISQAVEYPSVLSTRLAISGATNPGVPHFGKMYGCSSAYVARPKSTILSVYWFPILPKSRFSGLISRCMMLLLLQ